MQSMKEGFQQHMKEAYKVLENECQTLMALVEEKCIRMIPEPDNESRAILYTTMGSFLHTTIQFNMGPNIH